MPETLALLLGGAGVPTASKADGSLLPHDFPAMAFAMPRGTPHPPSAWCGTHGTLPRWNLPLSLFWMFWRHPKTQTRYVCGPAGAAEETEAVPCRAAAGPELQRSWPQQPGGNRPETCQESHWPWHKQQKAGKENLHIQIRKVFTPLPEAGLSFRALETAN